MSQKQIIALLLPMLVLLCGRSSAQTNRFSIALFAGHAVTSQAITNPIGITKDFSGKYWGGLKVGYDLVARPKTRFGIELGAAYRDYGFNENQSTIPYLSGLACLRLRRRLFWRLHLVAYGGGEYAKVYESKYLYTDPSSGTINHNLFLHQNDALLAVYGGGLALSFNRLGITLGFEKTLQLDTFDLQYGKTLGGRFSNVSLYYYLF